jgi:DNA-directed RNA polymerase subunit M/transcription elongation factor TFIIS
MSFLDVLGEIVDAVFDKDYICKECGSKMVWEDEQAGFLVCENCGYGTDLDHYGKTDEEWEDEYPIIYDEEDERDPDDNGETYDEVYNELDTDY